MARTTDVEMKLCVAWKTSAPQSVVCRSFGFRLGDSEWRLQMSSSGPPSNAYIVTLFRSDCKRPEPLLEVPLFFVTTFIKDVENLDMYLPSVTRVESTFQEVWENVEGEISHWVRGFKEGAEFKIVCMFHDSPDCPIPQKLSVKTSTRNDAYDAPRGLESLSFDLSKMLDDEALSDVKLSCNDCTIFAHKTVLAARSDVFAAMFRNKMAESETGAVNLSDMDANIFELFVKYLYSGKVLDLSEDIVSELYEAADMYAVHELKEECSRWICGNVTEENCFDFLSLADAHGDQAMKDAVVDFFLENVELLNCEAWDSFSEEHPKLSNSVYRKCFRENYFKSGL